MTFLENWKPGRLWEVRSILLCYIYFIRKYCCSGRSYTTKTCKVSAKSHKDMWQLFSQSWVKEGHYEEINANKVWLPFAKKKELFNSWTTIYFLSRLVSWLDTAMTACTLCVLMNSKQVWSCGVSKEEANWFNSRPE